MRLLTIILSKIKKITLYNKASFSTVFAFSIIPLLSAVFLLTLIINLYHKKVSLENANNVAILAGASKMVSNFSKLGENITNYANKYVIMDVKKFIRNHLKESLSVAVFDKTEINHIADKAKVDVFFHNKDSSNNFQLSKNQSSFKDNKMLYHINITTFYDYYPKFLGNLFAEYLHKTIVVFMHAIVKMEIGNRSVSFLEFVIDLSGSMNCSMDVNPENQDLYNMCLNDKKRSKITALKNAMLLFLNTIGNIPNAKQKNYVGLVGYTESIVKNIPPSWGTENIRQYVEQKMDSITNAGTNSAPAMKKAYKELTADERSNFFSKLLHKRSKLPSMPLHKYIIFLTDGANNYQKNDQQTLKICEKAKNHSIKIFTISINSPASGRYLLKKCASSIEYYYNVIDISSMLQVFQNISTLIARNKYEVILKE
ncbi:MAG: VWA domain-containing protein [Candidatus Liberibacter europaeus]|uniref:VWA domain-containing protein n=1 Tax=Candidatus Liberibacter europaeus TaxID=744859 RepID=A0A2T4VXF3_9HYPH|nr:VWA domain-containing protein [Candidatus Liberibacter europaeus]PTL86455.1 MAG: VWA domain-containing protein [Candidatus Liberibacter europaeus]